MTTSHCSLQIRDVQDSDQGAYMCQINTPAAKTRVGFLNVVGKKTGKYDCFNLGDVLFSSFALLLGRFVTCHRFRTFRTLVHWCTRAKDDAAYSETLYLEVEQNISLSPPFNILSVSALEIGVIYNGNVRLSDLRERCNQNRSAYLVHAVY